MPNHPLLTTDLLKKVWSESPVGIAVISSNGTFCAVSPSCSALLGYSETELQEITVLELVHYADRKPFTAELNKLAADPEAGGFEMVSRMQTKSGNVVQCSVASASIRDGEDHLTCAVVFITALPVSHRFHLEMDGDGARLRGYRELLDFLRDNKRSALISACILLCLGRALDFSAFGNALKSMFGWFN